MAMIDDKYLQRLKEAGLYISEPFPEGHGWEHGVRIGKPVTTPGNSIPDYDDGYITIGSKSVEPPEIDSPIVIFYHKGNSWVVHSQECVPDPGPGDFQNVWNTPEEALDDIIDFFFGDPERMRRKAERKEAARKRAQARKD